MSTRFSDIHIIDIDDRHLLGRVHSWVSGSVVDGPGIRYVVFLQGCQLQCLYCHNRDSWDPTKGSLYSVDEIVEGVLDYARFIDASHGGVTVSGGEPLLQPVFLTRLFEKCRSLDLHTCLDTNGHVAPQLYGATLERLLRVTDLVMLDIKHMNNVKHRQLTGVDNTATLDFARHLQAVGHALRIRYVVVPGYNDAHEDLHQLGVFLGDLANLEKLELLPYHQLGVHKWRQLGLTYPLANVPPPTQQKMLNIKRLFETGYGLDVLL